MDVTLVVDALGPQLSGIGRYVWELCRRMPVEPGVGDVRFFAGGRFLDDPRDIVEQRAARRRLRLPVRIGRRIVERRLRRSLVHGPNYFLPAEAETGIITVHDLSVFRYPETHPPDRLAAFERRFDSSLRRARLVITDTEAVRGEVIAEFALPEAMVTAVPLGVSSQYRPREDSEMRTRLAAFGLTPRAYALCVSTLEPRKKIGELLAAWAGLPASLRESMPLVLAGAEGWLNEDLHRRIGEATARGWLKHLGFVPEESLPALYSGAALFLYPSIYEGFGLPPLEAMASGVPVIVANRSCLPEVCGDAAAYVDPDDLPAFTQAIAEALSDSRWQQAARERGLQRAALFSWESCAARTAEVYRRHAP